MQAIMDLIKFFMRITFDKLFNELLRIKLKYIN